MQLLSDKCVRIELKLVSAHIVMLELWILLSYSETELSHPAFHMVSFSSAFCENLFTSLCIFYHTKSARVSTRTFNSKLRDSFGQHITLL